MAGGIIQESPPSHAPQIELIKTGNCWFILRCKIGERACLGWVIFALTDCRQSG